MGQIKKILKKYQRKQKKIPYETTNSNSCASLILAKKKQLKMGTLKLKSQGKKHPKKDKVFLLLNEKDIPYPNAFKTQCKVRTK